MSRVSCGSRHHARERGLAAFRRLVMKVSAGDAIHKRFLFFAVGKFQVGSEAPRDGEGLLLSPRLLGQGRLPGLITPNSKRSRIRRLRSSFRAEEAFRHI